MKRQGYKFGVAWIAENDNSGMGDDVLTIAAYVSTLLLSDLFGKEPREVAEAIYGYRCQQNIGPQPEQQPCKQAK
jgi:hypothetical protein